VLVGGEGTRLQPLTFTTPKQMLPVAEVTIIERVLDHLAAHGVTDAVLSLGYQPDAFLGAKLSAGLGIRPFGLYRENRVQPIEFKNVRIAKPVAVVAEVPEAGPRAERQHDRGRPCAIGSTT